MKYPVLLILTAWSHVALAQPQVSILLSTDTGVKDANNFKFNITGSASSSISFIFNNFSKDGRYYNKNLYQLNDILQLGQYLVSMTLSGKQAQTITDTLDIDSNTARVEIYVRFASAETGDYIKELETMIIQKEADHLQFTTIDPTTPGNKAAFQITNKSKQAIVGYPNPAFFFGKLYAQVGRDRWVAHYPKSVDFKFCDTVAAPHPLQAGASTTAWTPMNEHCITYRFNRQGKYYFDLFYSVDGQQINKMVGPTRIKRCKLYRKQHIFTVYTTAQA